MVQRQPGQPPPATGEEYYRRYVDLTYLRPYLAIPFFLSVFILLLYFLGKFMAAGIGRFFWDSFDRLISRLPVVQVRLFVDQASQRFHLYRTRVEIHADRRRRVSPQGHLVDRVL